MAFTKARLHQALVHTGFVLFSVSFVSGCLNTTSSNGGSTLKYSQGTGVGVISPYSVKLTWDDKRAKTYNIRELTKGQDVLASTPFLSQVAQTLPNLNYQFRVTPQGSDGTEFSRSFEYDFSSWPAFTGTLITSESVEEKGLSIKWDYNPWNTIPADEASLAKAVVTCKFLKNGITSQDPFKEPSAYTVTAPLKDMKLTDTKCQLPTNSDYLTSCAATFADGKTDVVATMITAHSPTSCVNPENLPKISMDPIQVSPFPGLYLEDLAGGNMSLKMVGYDETTRPWTEKPLWSFNASYPDSTKSEESADILNEILFSGYGRMSGEFTSHSSGVKSQMVAKDIYLKSVNDHKSALFPPVVSVAAAQQMGSSFAVGDFNCDGLDDLAVGMPATAWEDDSDPRAITKRKTGVVVIFYSGAQGLSYGASIPSRDPQDTGGTLAPKILVPLTPSEGAGPYTDAGLRFGASMTVGNLNRDYQGYTGNSCDDLVIGAPNETFYNQIDGTSSTGGGIYIAYGSPSGLKGDWTTTNTYDGESSGTCTPGTAPDNNLPARNMPIAMNPASSGCSGVHLYVPSGRNSSPGDTAFTVTNLHEALSDTYFEAQYNNIFSFTGCCNSTAEFGASVATGDFNGDGFDDIIVGAPNTRTDTPAADGQAGADHNHFWAGAAFVFFGSKTGVYLKTDLGFRAMPKIDGSSGAPAPNMANDNLLKPPSPIKIIPSAAMLARFGGDWRLGTSVAIGELRDRDQLDGGYLKTSSGGTESIRPKRGGSIFIGAPNLSYGAGNSGAVIAAHWNQHFDPVDIRDVSGGNLASDQCAASNQPLYCQYHVPTLLIEDTNNGKFKYPGNTVDDAVGAYVLPNPTGPTRGTSELFGAALAVGNFRDPFKGLGVANMGLDYNTIKPYKQVLAVGSPGYNNNKGALYYFTDNQIHYPQSSAGGSSANPPYQGGGRQTLGTFKGGTNVATGWETAGSGHAKADAKTLLNLSTDVYSSGAGYQNVSLCESSSSCLSTVRVSNPNGQANQSYFGNFLSVGRTPIQVGQTRCSISSSDSDGNNTCDQSNALSFTFASGYADALYVGGGGGGSTPKIAQNGFVYESQVTTGISSSAIRFNAVDDLTGEQFGSAGAIGYFKSHDLTLERFQVVVGAPNFAQPVPAAGQVYLYKRDSNGALLNNSPIGLSYKNIKTAGGVDYFNYSGLSGLGFHRAKPVGDLNCDGYMDVAMPVEYQSGSNLKSAYLLIVYGSATGLNYKDIPNSPNTPRARQDDPRAPQWLNLNNYAGIAGIDTAATYFFEGVGNVNGDTVGGKDCDDLVVGNQSNYIFYGSSNGLLISGPKYDSIALDGTPQEIKMEPPTETLPDGPPQYQVTDATHGIQSNNNSDTSVFLDSSINYLGQQNLPTSTPRLSGFENIGTWVNNLNGLGYQPSVAYTDNDMYPICGGDFNGDGYNDVVIGTLQQASIGSWYGTTTYSGTSPTTTYGPHGNGPYNIDGFFSVYYGATDGLQLKTRGVPGAKYDATCDNGNCPAQRLFYPPMFHDANIAGTGSGTEDAFFPYRPWREFFLRQSLAADSRTLTSADYPKLAKLKYLYADLFGRSCTSVGDINGDGYDDLLVTMPDAASSLRGTSFVLFFGSKAGLKQTDALMVRLTDGGNANQPYAAALPANSMLGASAAALGDVNGDKIPDFAIGAPGSNAFVVIFGRGGNWLDKLSPINDDTYKFGGNTRYEVWRKMPVATAVQGRPETSIPSCVGSTCWGVIVKGDIANVGFGNMVQGAGDVNKDGYADIVVGAPGYSAATSTGSGVGSAVVYFGDQNKYIHAASPATDKARCKGTESARVCSPLRLVPKFATELGVDGFRNNDLFTNQNWRPRSKVIIRSKLNRDEQNPEWFYPNFGSRTGQTSADTDSSDILMCLLKNYRHEQLDTYTDLGLCGVYY